MQLNFNIKTLYIYIFLQKNLLKTTRNYKRLYPKNKIDLQNLTNCDKIREILFYKVSLHTKTEVTYDYYRIQPELKSSYRRSY